MTDLSTLSDDELRAIAAGAKESTLARWSDDELRRIASGKTPMSAGDKFTDVVKSAGMGLVDFAVGTLGFPGDLQALTEAGVSKLTGAPAKERQELSSPGVPHFPTSKDVQSKVEEWTGPFYQSQTPEGKGLRTITGFMAGAGITSAPRNVVQNLVRYGVVPGVASEAAGRYFEGTPKESPARVVAALAAPLSVSGVRRIITPLPASAEHARMVDVLAQEGVRPTAGQASDRRWLKYMESSLGDLPGAGGRAAQMMERQGEQFTAAAMRRAGENAPRATAEVMEGAFNRIGQQFDDLAARNNVAVDRQFANDVAAVQADYNFLANPMQQQVVNNAINDIVQVIQQNNGIITGAQYQAMRSRLGKAAKSVRGNDQQLSDAMYGIQNALDEAMERSIAVTGNTSDIAAWRETRDQYRNILALEKAVTASGADAAKGIISPSHLRNAAVAQNRHAYATGGGDFADLARAGEGVLKPLPQSGTAPRAAAIGLPAALGAGIGHLAGGAEGMTAGAMAGAALSASVPSAVGRALMSGPVQGWLGNQVLGPPTPAQRIARLLSAAHATYPVRNPQ